MRVSKREFVKGAGAVALAFSAGGPADRAAREGIPSGGGLTADTWAALASPGSIDVVVYNNWFPQAHAFAASFPAARMLPVDGDAGQLWYGTLRGLVKNGCRRIAGLTTHNDLLILETLAREAGPRVRKRRESGRLVSWVLI